MLVHINIDELSDKGKHILNLLRELEIDFNTNTISAKDAAIGIGRAATDDELDEYLARCMNGTLTDIDDI